MSFTVETLLSGSSLDLLEKPGVYIVPSAAGGPASASFYVIVIGGNVDGFSRSMQQVTNTATGTTYTRYKTAAGAWADWTELGAGGGGGSEPFWVQATEPVTMSGSAPPTLNSSNDQYQYVLSTDGTQTANFAFITDGEPGQQMRLTFNTFTDPLDAAFFASDSGSFFSGDGVTEYDAGEFTFEGAFIELDWHSSTAKWRVTDQSGMALNAI